MLNTETLIVASKEFGLEANTDKTRNMVMSLDQNAGRNHNIKIHNISYERVEEFIYLETVLTNQIVFRMKLRADRNQDMLAIIRFRILCLPVCYSKIKRLRYTEL